MKSIRTAFFVVELTQGGSPNGFKVDEPQIKATVRELITLEEAKGAAAEAKLLQWVSNNHEKLYVSRPVTGILTEGMGGFDDNDTFLIEASNFKLAENFVILQENARPPYAYPILMIASGLGLVVWGIRRLLVRV